MNNRQRKKLNKILDDPSGRIAPAKEGPKNSSGYLADMFVNAMARTGMGSQSLMNTTEYELTRITKNYQLLTTLYRENWIAKKIINTIPEDMCRNWFEITTELDPKLLDRYKKLEKRTKIKSKILEALYWSRLFGGSAAVMLIAGQDNLSDPLDIDTIMPRAFKGLLVVDRWTGIYPETDLITDINDPDYGLPEYYQLTDESTSQVVRIHHSRLLRFPGRKLPRWEDTAEMHWGASELEHVFEELAKRDNTSWNIASLIFRASIIATKTDGLDVMLAAGDAEAQRQFYQTQQAINTMLNNNSLLNLGKDDEIQQLNYTFSGLNDVYESFMLDVAGASEIPVTKLFGREPAGLNATGESDEKNYNSKIESEQENKLRPALEQLLPVMFMSEFGVVPNDLDFRFLPVQSPSEGDVADLVSKKATSIKDVFDSGIINQKIAMKELKAMSDSTGMFTNITDEDIENASEDFADENMLQGVRSQLQQPPSPDGMNATAFDEDRWITVKKSKNGEGRKVKIDEDGNIVGGSIPRSAKGKSIKSWWKKGREKGATHQEEQKNLNKSDMIKKGKDIPIQKSLGAAAKNYKVRLPSGAVSKLAEGTNITKVYTFAGKGTNKEIHIAKSLEKGYNVPAVEWKKSRGDGYVIDEQGIVRHAELHWYESKEAGRVEMKVKRYFDEG